MKASPITIYITIFSVVFFCPMITLSQGIEITSGGNITVTGSANIEIRNGDFINNGTYTKGSETFTMSGNIAKTISGSGSTYIQKLSITNTGRITTKHSQINLYNLLISPNCQLTIDTSKAVSVSNTITNNANESGIYIKSSAIAANGSLTFHNSSMSPVSATVEMYSKASKVGTSWKWQFFGIPLRTMINTPTFDGSYVRKFNEAGIGSGYTSDKHWIQLQTGNSMTSFTGYEVTQTSPTTFYFSGQLENSDYSSGKLPFTTTGQYPGQHLISNPYTAAIDIKKITFGSPRSKVIENTVYFYNTGSSSDWTTGGSGGTAGNNPGQYIAIPTQLAGENGIPAQIPSMQAFLVVVTSDNDSARISIPYSSVETIVKNTDKQRIKTSEGISTRIEIAGSRFIDKMWLFTNPLCSKDFDNGWDGYKYTGSSLSPQIYDIETSGNYQVNTTNNINNTLIGFIPGEDTDYKLSFYHQNSQSIYPQLYLIDLVTNKITDITQSGTEYSFTSTNNPSNSARFKIMTDAGTTTASTNIVQVQKEIVIFNSEKTIIINNKSAESGNLFIRNMAGNTILQAKISGSKITSIPTNISTGSYICSVITNSGSSTAKIVIN
jgi:hypothetical protein